MYQVGDILLSLTVFQLGDHRAYITRPYRVRSAEAPITDKDFVAALLSAGVAGPAASFLAFPAKLAGVWVRKVYPTVDQETGQNTNVDAPIPFPMHPMPGQAAVLVKLLSDDRNAVRDGMMFLPYLSNHFLDTNGRLTPAGVTQATNMATPYSFDANNVILPPLWSLQPVLWSRKRRVWTTWSEMRVSTRISTQRRRSHAYRPTALPYGRGPPGV